MPIFRGFRCSLVSGPSYTRACPLYRQRLQLIKPRSADAKDTNCCCAAAKFCLLAHGFMFVALASGVQNVFVARCVYAYVVSCLMTNRTFNRLTNNAASAARTSFATLCLRAT